jgi:outer membrane protein assembly factor BamA
MAPIQQAPSVPTCDSLLVKYIVLTGNNITQRHIILRELEYVEGQKLAVTDTSALFRVGRNRIFNLRLFVTVSQSVIPLAIPGQGCPLPIIVEIHVKERWYVFPFPILELADRSINEWLYNQHANFNRINYGVRVEANNIRGRNETLKLVGQWGFTRKAELSYSIPYLSKRLKEGLTLEAQYLTNNQVSARSDSNKQDFFESANRTPLYRRFRAGGEFSYRPQYWITHRLAANFLWSSLTDSLARAMPEFYQNGKSSQRLFQVGYNFTYDRRDIRQYPLKGYYLNISVEKLGLRPADDVNIWSAGIATSLHTPLGGAWFMANGLSGTVSSPGKQPYSQSRFLGFGQNMVRGYEKYVLESPISMVVKNTVRYRLFRRTVQLENMPLHQFSTLPFAIYLKAYGDAGYAQNHNVTYNNARLLNTWLWGGGVGVDFVTYYDYVLRLEYSINRQGERGVFFHVAVEI